MAFPVKIEGGQVLAKLPPAALLAEATHRDARAR